MGKGAVDFGRQKLAITTKDGYIIIYNYDNDTIAGPDRKLYSNASYTSQRVIHMRSKINSAVRLVGVNVVDVDTIGVNPAQRDNAAPLSSAITLPVLNPHASKRLVDGGSFLHEPTTLQNPRVRRGNDSEGSLVLEAVRLAVRARHRRRGLVLNNTKLF